MSALPLHRTQEFSDLLSTRRRVCSSDRVRRGRVVVGGFDGRVVVRRICDDGARGGAGERLELEIVP